MNQNKLIKQVHRRIAQVSVGSSAIRNQGSGGLIKICHDYFEKSIDLKEFGAKIRNNGYPEYLDNCTHQLLSLFPEEGKSWGAARKGLNLFFREVVYNKYLADYLNIPNEYSENLERIKQLEVPLDKDVATGLIKIYDELPKWKSIKVLQPEESKLYQKFALIYAERQNIARVHLDLEFWRKEK